MASDQTGDDTNPLVFTVALLALLVVVPLVAVALFLGLFYMPEIG